MSVLETSGRVDDGEDRAYEQRTSGGPEGEHDCLLAHGRERGQYVGNKDGCGSAQGGRNFVCRRKRFQKSAFRIGVDTAKNGLEENQQTGVNLQLSPFGGAAIDSPSNELLPFLKLIVEPFLIADALI